VTKFIPLHKADKVFATRTLDYGKCVLIRTIMSFDSFLKLIEGLPEKGIMTYTIGGFKVQVEGHYLGQPGIYDSGADYLDVG